MGGTNTGEKKPTIRILILGAEGVGKNCLESRFTTRTYPPSYDPALTLSSRRFFTLSPHAAIDSEAAVTRLLDTSYGLASPPPLLSLNFNFDEGTGTFDRDERPHDGPRQRPRSASSTFSNLGSHPPPPNDTAILEKEDDDNAFITPPRQTNLLRNPCCADCRDDATYLVEVTNFPALQIPKVRAHVLARGDYDAVLLVYDVNNRSSFEVVADLYSEIPPILRSSRHNDRKRAVRKTRSSIWGSIHHNNTENQKRGGGETVIALIGNKSDYSDDHDDIDQLYFPYLDKEAVLQEADVEERSLVHPLYRESRVFEDPPLSPRSVRSVPVIDNRLNSRMTMTGDLGADVRRSVFSEGYRVSIFSGGGGRRSLDLVPEEIREQQYPPEQQPLSATTVENWIKTGGHMMVAPAADTTTSTGNKTEEECTRVASYVASDSTTTARRQVSRFEGEMLARTLLVNVPFYETSAKTGQNVEEAFEAIVREVLKAMGRDVGLDGHKHDKDGHDMVNERGGVIERGVGGKQKKVRGGTKKGAVLRKEKREPGAVHDIALEPTVPSTKKAEDTTSETPSVATYAALEIMMDAEPPFPPLPTPQKRRRGSVLERFKRAFTKRSSPIVPDLAV
ncbi:hypothetical protein B0H63DRAFT_537656 [Podospora didyma]|uniref:Uncharacterized protein n=1 Tax=Podospora didyma TaxID=330526 RepID=A0AAE0U3V6_9PEZI|nr:hypothetical protein B0H63DRAFT_537656 [Podospora didyma]